MTPSAAVMVSAALRMVALAFSPALVVPPEQRLVVLKAFDVVEVTFDVSALAGPCITDRRQRQSSQQDGHECEVARHFNRLGFGSSAMAVWTCSSPKMEDDCAWFAPRSGITAACRGRNLADENGVFQGDGLGVLAEGVFALR